jgi:DNA repair exonuclease SbcCD ATPase subunit
MPDIQFFDAAGFFMQKVSEVEQTLIGKMAELEIVYANRKNLEQTIATMALLDPAYQKAIQAELASLKEVLGSTERSIMGLESEIEILSNKLAALQSARSLLPVKDQTEGGAMP